jgi:hypothetical protein
MSDDWYTRGELIPELSPVLERDEYPVVEFAFESIHKFIIRQTHSEI